MPAKPNPLLGLVIGVVAAWLGTIAVSYAGVKLNNLRSAMFVDSSARSIPWILLILVVALALGLLMSSRSIGAGALVGAGLVLTVSFLAVRFLPPRTAIDFSKLFEVPGAIPTAYMVWDSAQIFIGGVLFVLGVRRWFADTRRTPLPVQDAPAYYQQPGQQRNTFPG